MEPMSRRYALEIAVLSMGLLSVPVAVAEDGADSCIPYIAATEKSAGIPDGLLRAIGLTESGRVTSNGHRVPWPWTVNAQGKGYFFDSKEEAIAFVQKLQAQGIDIIDVGCLQVNLYHHPTAFASLDAAFDPATNIAYAAKFLNELKNETGDWDIATQYYHSRTPYLGEAYGERVARADGVVAVAEPVVPLSAEEKAILRRELGNQLATSDELIARSPALRRLKPPISGMLQHETTGP
jgi:hypothetical protein